MFFLDFGVVAGLHLNIAKTVVVPLYNYVEEDIRSPITIHSPDWGVINGYHMVGGPSHDI